LFISDLHLDGAHPQITDQFLRFLVEEAKHAKALYILGDLFEAWIGDDDPDADKRRAIRAVRDLASTGAPCSLIHGNRDVLIGKRFCEAAGVRLVEVGTVVKLYGRRVLLVPGVSLGTHDAAYQRLRRIVRNPLVQFAMRRLSLRQR